MGFCPGVSLYPFVRYVGCCVVIDMHGSHYATFRAGASVENSITIIFGIEAK